MNRIGHVFKELFRNLYKNPGTSLSAILSMILLFLLFDIFWIAADTSDKFYENYLSDLKMEVFISEEYPDSSLGVIKDEIKKIDGVSSMTFISKETARKELTDLVGVDLLVGYDSSNPLPQSLILTFRPDVLNSADLSEIENRIMSQQGVSNVYYSKNWLAKAESTKNIIADIGLLLGGLILLTVLVSSANNMRLTAKTRASGFYQMRLLGAGKLLLAMPFIIEGVLLGALSAGIGWGMIYYWKDKIQFANFEIIFPTLEEIGFYCLAAGLLGLISGYVGIRRQLRL